MTTKTGDAFQKEQADIRPLRKHFYEKMGRKGFGVVEVDNAMEQFKATLARMNAALEHQPWLTGPNVGLVDFIAAPLVDRMNDLGFEEMWAIGAPHVSDWFDKLRDRPSYSKAFYPKSRLSEFLPIGPLHRHL